MEINYLPHEQEITKKKYRKKGQQFYRSTCRSCGGIVEYAHGEKPSHCPHCKEEDYIKPVTETRLFLLQDKYLKTRDDSILWSMYILFKEYSVSMIKKSLPSTFTYHYQDVEEKAGDLALIMFEQYKKKPNFQIIKSFGAYLSTKVPQVLWNKRAQEEENHESLNTHFSDENENEILQLVDQLNLNPIFREYSEYLHRKRSKKELYEGIEKLFEDITKEIHKSFEIYYLILSMIGVWNYIKHQGHMENFYDSFGMKVKPTVDKIMVLFYEYLKEHSEEYSV